MYAVSPHELVHHPPAQITPLSPPHHAYDSYKDFEIASLFASLSMAPVMLYELVVHTGDKPPFFAKVAEKLHLTEQPYREWQKAKRDNRRIRDIEFQRQRRNYLQKDLEEQRTVPRRE